MNALGDLCFQSFELLKLGVLDKDVLKIDLTDILREERIQFLECFVKHSGDAVVHLLL